MLLPNGKEHEVLTGPACVPGSPATLPWANPANIAFDDACGPTDPALFAIFDAIVNDKSDK